MNLSVHLTHYFIFLAVKSQPIYLYVTRPEKTGFILYVKFDQIKANFEFLKCDNFYFKHSIFYYMYRKF